MDLIETQPISPIELETNSSIDVQSIPITPLPFDGDIEDLQIIPFPTTNDENISFNNQRRNSLTCIVSESSPLKVHSARCSRSSSKSPTNLQLTAPNIMKPHHHRSKSVSNRSSKRRKKLKTRKINNSLSPSPRTRSKSKILFEDERDKKIKRLMKENKEYRKERNELQKENERFKKVENHLKYKMKILNLKMGETVNYDSKQQDFCMMIDKLMEKAAKTQENMTKMRDELEMKYKIEIDGLKEEKQSLEEQGYDLEEALQKERQMTMIRNQNV